VTPNYTRIFRDGFGALVEIRRSIADVPQAGEERAQEDEESSASVNVARLTSAPIYGQTANTLSGPSTQIMNPINTREQSEPANTSFGPSTQITNPINTPEQSEPPAHSNGDSISTLEAQL
jgi:hypothetical protein